MRASSHNIPRKLYLFASIVALCIAPINLTSASGFIKDDTAAAQAALGKKLFFDVRLSGDQKTSCASCHNPAFAFSDARAISLGAFGKRGTRNAPSLSYLPYRDFFWDGREPRLAEAVVQPFTNSFEMGLADTESLLLILKGDAPYRNAFMASFGESSPDIDKVGRALEAYIRGLNRSSSDYEHFRRGKRDALDLEEKRGLYLFSGAAGCSNCHVLKGEESPFTDHRFHHSPTASSAGTAIATRVVSVLNSREHIVFDGDSILGDAVNSRLGRFLVSRRAIDIGRFRTPTLRNVALTAPYMHDGSVQTLEQAIDREIYYRNTGGHLPAYTPADGDRKAIASFLRSLTDGD